MDPNKAKTDFSRPDRDTTAQGAPPHERGDDRTHGFSQDSGYPASGGARPEQSKTDERAAKHEKEVQGRRGEILSQGPHDNRPGTTVLNLNTATRDEIAQVDFVGATYADAIVALREKLGSFASWEQLRQVEGLKANKIAELQRTFRLDTSH
jgi:competence ComEA-like helix-hairpin-helix protein